MTSGLRAGREEGGKEGGRAIVSRRDQKTNTLLEGGTLHALAKLNT